MAFSGRGAATLPVYLVQKQQNFPKEYRGEPIATQKASDKTVCLLGDCFLYGMTAIGGGRLALKSFDKFRFLQIFVECGPESNCRM
jgi:hypothetical protein